MSKAAKHTPGPWQWAKHSDGEVYLVHPHRGWLVVMDFARLGMQKAQPRFATWKGDERENMGGIMVPAAELEIAAHPDAQLIALTPELLAALQACELAMDTAALHGIGAFLSPAYRDTWAAAHTAARAVLAKLTAGV